MSSKNVDTSATVENLLSRSWSMTGRLTLLFTLSFLGMLFLAILFLFLALTDNLAREDNEFLADKIQVLRTILQKFPHEPKALEEEVKWEGTAQQVTHYFARIMDDQGNVQIETPSMAGTVPVTLFPTPAEVLQEPGEGVKWKSDGGKTFLLRSAWIHVAPKDKKRFLLHVALDISREEALLADFRRKMAAVLLVGVLCSAGICAVITRRGMRPVHDITEATQRITASHLHERIGAVPWPQELGSLALAFDRMLDRLEDSFNRLSRFSADLAHELRTPINGLMGAAEVALSRNRDEEEYRQIIEAGLEEHGRLSRIIDSLLFLARAENDEIRIERSLLDARKELETVREFYDAVAEEQGVVVLCQGEATFSAEPLLFRRAVGNLLANALQHTPPGGMVTLAVAEPLENAVAISVSDTGPGIPPEHLPHIFDRFYRVDAARTQQPEGTGLGLAIVKSIMELHGGTVSVESRPGTNTTFTLRFPLS